VIFKDEAARDAYLPHLLQQVHVAKLLPMLESGIEGDLKQKSIHCSNSCLPQLTFASTLANAPDQKRGDK
jgi:hypothetical protein